MNETNKQAAEQINDMLELDPVVFIGAGLSIPPYKTWPALIDELKQALGFEGELPNNPLRAAQQLYEYDAIGLENHMKRIFGPEPDDCRSALQDIASIDFKAFVTTNFDQTIGHAFAYANRSAIRPLAYPVTIQASLCQSQSITCVHGLIADNFKSLNDIIFHESAYQRSYGSDGRLAAFMFDLFTSNNVLFTGYGLGADEPLNYVLRSVLRVVEQSSEIFQTEIRRKTWKILLDLNDNEEGFLKRLDEFGIQVIRYDRLNDDFSGLDEVWHRVAYLVKRANRSKFREPFQALANPNFSGETE